MSQPPPVSAKQEAIRSRLDGQYDNNLGGFDLTGALADVRFLLAELQAAQEREQRLEVELRDAERERSSHAEVASLALMREKALREALRVYADHSTWGVTRAYSDLGHVIWLGEQDHPWQAAEEALAAQRTEEAGG